MKIFSITILAGCMLTDIAQCRPAQSLETTGGSGGALKVTNCDSNADWSARNFLKEDCYVSVLDMFLQDYRPHPQTEFDFYSGLLPPSPTSNRIQTPRRYTTKSCTLALVMLYNFKGPELPGTFRSGHSHTELATFGEIYNTAQRLQQHCIVGRGQTSRLAWEPVGEYTDLSLWKLRM
ncbi:MAG: hypothetical protein Q9223_001337 [Gallowayella weberi]